MNYVPTTLGVQSWREIISGGTRTKKVEYHWPSLTQTVLTDAKHRYDEHSYAYQKAGNIIDQFLWIILQMRIYF
jgi:hypothetical protein